MQRAYLYLRAKQKSNLGRYNMRTFKMDRHQDLSGNSGTGIVAEGVEFSDGTVALRWLTDTATTTFYDNIDHVMQLHHHEGATEIVFDDEEIKESSMKPADELKKLAGELEESSAQTVADYVQKNLPGLTISEEDVANLALSSGVGQDCKQLIDLAKPLVAHIAEEPAVDLSGIYAALNKLMEVWYFG